MPCAVGKIKKICVAIRSKKSSKVRKSLIHTDDMQSAPAPVDGDGETHPEDDTQLPSIPIDMTSEAKPVLSYMTKSPLSDCSHDLSMINERNEPKSEKEDETDRKSVIYRPELAKRASDWSLYKVYGGDQSPLHHPDVAEDPTHADKTASVEELAPEEGRTPAEHPSSLDIASTEPPPDFSFDRQDEKLDVPSHRHEMIASDPNRPAERYLSQFPDHNVPPMPNEGPRWLSGASYDKVWAIRNAAQRRSSATPRFRLDVSGDSASMIPMTSSSDYLLDRCRYDSASQFQVYRILEPEENGSPWFRIYHHPDDWRHVTKHEIHDPFYTIEYDGDNLPSYKVTGEMFAGIWNNPDLWKYWYEGGRRGEKKFHAKDVCLHLRETNEEKPTAIDNHGRGTDAPQYKEEECTQDASRSQEDDSIDSDEAAVLTSIQRSNLYFTSSNTI